MGKRIIYTNPETGMLCVIIPVNNSLTIEEIAAKDVPEGLEFSIVDAADIPEDRTYREAWTQKDNGLDVDLDKAKNIQIDRWRVDRKPLLEALDAEYMKALESNDKAKQIEIVSKKQSLRDLPEVDLSHIVTVEELRAFTPEALREVSRD